MIASDATKPVRVGVPQATQSLAVSAEMGISSGSSSTLSISQIAQVDENSIVDTRKRDHDPKQADPVVSTLENVLDLVCATDAILGPSIDTDETATRTLVEMDPVDSILQVDQQSNGYADIENSPSLAGSTGARNSITPPCSTPCSSLVAEVDENSIVCARDRDHDMTQTDPVVSTLENVLDLVCATDAILGPSMDANDTASCTLVEMDSVDSIYNVEISNGYVDAEVNDAAHHHNNPIDHTSPNVVDQRSLGNVCTNVAEQSPTLNLCSNATTVTPKNHSIYSTRNPHLPVHFQIGSTRGYNPNTSGMCLRVSAHSTPSMAPSQSSPNVASSSADVEYVPVMCNTPAGYIVVRLPENTEIAEVVDQDMQKAIDSFVDESMAGLRDVLSNVITRVVNDRLSGRNVNITMNLEQEDSDNTTLSASYSLQIGDNDTTSSQSRSLSHIDHRADMPIPINSFTGAEDDDEEKEVTEPVDESEDIPEVVVAENHSEEHIEETEDSDDDVEVESHATLVANASAIPINSGDFPENEEEKEATITSSEPEASTEVVEIESVLEVISETSEIRVESTEEMEEDDDAMDVPNQPQIDRRRKWTEVDPQYQRDMIPLKRINALVNVFPPIHEVENESQSSHRGLEADGSLANESLNDMEINGNNGRVVSYENGAVEIISHAKANSDVPEDDHATIAAILAKLVADTVEATDANHTIEQTSVTSRIPLFVDDKIQSDAHTTAFSVISDQHVESADASTESSSSANVDNEISASSDSSPGVKRRRVHLQVTAEDLAEINDVPPHLAKLHAENQDDEFWTRYWGEAAEYWENEYPARDEDEEVVIRMDEDEEVDSDEPSRREVRREVWPHCDEEEPGKEDYKRRNKAHDEKCRERILRGASLLEEAEPHDVLDNTVQHQTQQSRLLFKRSSETLADSLDGHNDVPTKKRRENQVEGIDILKDIDVDVAHPQIVQQLPPIDDEVPVEPEYDEPEDDDFDMQHQADEEAAEQEIARLEAVAEEDQEALEREEEFYEQILIEELERELKHLQDMANMAPRNLNAPVPPPLPHVFNPPQNRRRRPIRARNTPHLFGGFPVRLQQARLTMLSVQDGIDALERLEQVITGRDFGWRWNDLLTRLRRLQRNFTTFEAKPPAPTALKNAFKRIISLRADVGMTTF